MSVIDLGLAKSRRIEKALDMSPRQLIDLVKDDFERGDFKNPVGAIVLIIDETEDGGRIIESYRAGVDRAEEIGYAEAWKVQRLNDWQV